MGEGPDHMLLQNGTPVLSKGDQIVGARPADPQRTRTSQGRKYQSAAVTKCLSMGHTMTLDEYRELESKQ